MRTPEQIVQMEVHYCVSQLVRQIAEGSASGQIKPDKPDLRPEEWHGALWEIGDAAEVLVDPVHDYEEAASQEGWRQVSDEHCFVNSHGEASYACNWQVLCRDHDIDPILTEVFEHWIVSNWLANRLDEHGEKVDRDFAGLAIWARTTTGQGIASDFVIQQIAEETGG